MTETKMLTAVSYYEVLVPDGYSTIHAYNQGNYTFIESELVASDSQGLTIYAVVTRDDYNQGEYAVPALFFSKVEAQAYADSLTPDYEDGMFIVAEMLVN